MDAEPVARNLVREAVHYTADDITAAGVSLSPRFVERDLGVTFVTALGRATDSTGVSVKAEQTVSLEDWPGVGRVDVVLVEPPSTPLAFIELKWGESTLYNCVWDLAKMALSVARRQTHAAYLVAGAPATDWHDSEGAELFAEQKWLMADLLTKYKRHWDFWRADVKTRPELLPHKVTTEPVISAPMEVRGASWELRAVEVSASDEDWVDPLSLISLKRWREHFSWAPGDLEILTHDEVAKIIGGDASIGKGPPDSDS